MEERSRATHEAYHGVEVSLPDGSVVECEALTVREATHWLRLLHVVENSDDVRLQNEAFLEFLEDFSAAIGIEDKRLAPAEVMAVARSFLRLPTWSPTGRETTKTLGRTTSSGPSTPSSNSTPGSTT